MKSKQLLRWVLLLLVVGVLAYLQYRPDSTPTDSVDSLSRKGADGSQDAGRGNQSIVDAFSARRSGVMVESAGVVERILPDDLEGSRHQRFIIRLRSGHSLLVSHNIDIARRIPIALEDRVQLRGQYEWNERGGVVHWTHHDPQGRHPGGWIRHQGELFE